MAEQAVGEPRVERRKGPRIRRFAYDLISLRMGLAGAFVGIVALTALILGLTMFFDMRSYVREDVRDRLRNAIGVAALELDPALHAGVRTRADESGQAYRAIKKRLQDIRQRSKDVRYVYTLRKTSDGRIQFVVDAEDDPKDMSHVGDVYKKPTRAMLAAFDSPYHAHVEKEFTTDDWGTYLSGFAPILGKDGKLESVVGMDISAANVVAYENRFLFKAIGILVAALILVTALGLLVARGISRPLLAIAEDMSRIQELDLDDHPVPRSRIREVIVMGTALENMRKGLRSFKRYVPADLVSELIELDQEAVLGAEKRELTLLFSDIADFTTISEKLPIERLASSLGDYFERMTSSILKTQGTVDKYIGDAIMAFWGAPRSSETHAFDACRAALACKRALAEMKPDPKIPEFVTRIGIHTGEAFVGNFGFSERMSYTAMGDAVNLASRLEGLNKQYGTRVLISESTYARVSRQMAARPIDCVAVKGKSKGVMVYELIAARADLDARGRELLDLHVCAFDLYRMRRWSDAERVFAQLSRAAPKDRAAQILRSRCSEFTRLPPPGDWNGVTALHEK